MRWFLASFFGVAAAMLAGCGNFTEDVSYYREGVGPRLQWDGLPNESVLLATYVQHICEQADINRTSVVSADGVVCHPVGREWAVFVQAGMNDIDRRCDAFLSWVDYIRRSKESWIKQMGDTVSATAAIVGATHVGPKPMQIINAAFNLGTDTFNNMTARLLTLADTTTVQSVVLGEQKKFRLDLNNKMAGINNRPTAMYVLRSYLRICMPMTIEQQINSTVTIYQQSGAAGLAEKAAEPNNEAVIAEPVTPRQEIGLPGRRERPAPPASYPEILVDPKVSPEFFAVTMKALCATEAEITSINQGTVPTLTKARIAIFENAYRPPRAAPSTGPNAAPKRADGKLDADEVREVRSLGGCVPGGGRNYYEKSTYPQNETGAEAVKVLVEALRKVPAGSQLSVGASLEGARDTIRAVRADPTIRVKLALPLPDELQDQVTRDFVLALPR